MKVLVIQNCAGEGIGLYERYLKEEDIRYSVFRAYHGRRFPNSYGYDAVIVQRRMKKLADTLLTDFFDVAGRGGR